MQSEKIVALTGAAGVEVEPIWASLLAKALEGKNVKELLANVGSGGGAPAVGGGAPAAAAGGAAPAEAKEEKKEEKKEEEKEESDDDMVSFICVPLAFPFIDIFRLSFHRASVSSTNCSSYFVYLHILPPTSLSQYIAPS
jgi:large subunit ribosomal protein LP1